MKKPIFPKGDSFLLVDGYNIIHAWEQLKDIAKEDLSAARDKLIHILSDYGGYAKTTVIIVFDAHGVKDGKGVIFEHKNLYVVYTKEAETADNYIEKTAHNMKKGVNVTVATNDYLEQVIVMSKGAVRLSAAELLQNIETAKDKSKEHMKTEKIKGNFLFDAIDADTAEYLEKLRRE